MELVVRWSFGAEMVMIYDYGMIPFGFRLGIGFDLCLGLDLGLDLVYVWVETWVYVWVFVRV